MTKLVIRGLQLRVDALHTDAREEAQEVVTSLNKAIEGWSFSPVLSLSEKWSAKYEEDEG